ncbi:MAG: hypothetical protein LBJ90_06200 [Treponema sp.]|jgi:hypothetical protein|nr:hypothetical protein [Treponema sp.]
MRKAWAFLTFFLLGFTFFPAFNSLYAQEEDPGSEEDEQIPIESDWDVYMPELYSLGDQTFTISLGVTFPTLFLQNGEAITHNLFPVGGTGSLAYNYFLDSHFNIGGEISGLFNYTLANNTLFIIPIGLRVGYQFIFRRFEFPLAVTIGIAPQRYLNFNYLGFFIKGGASVFFRFSPDWSFGLNGVWGWYPEWTKERDKDVQGNMIDVTLSARYHF